MKFRFLLLVAVILSASITAQTKEDIISSSATGVFTFDNADDRFANTMETTSVGEYPAYCEGTKTRAETAEGNSTDFEDGVLDTDFSIVTGVDGNALRINTDYFLYLWHGMSVDATEQHFNSDGTPKSEVYIGTGVNNYTVMMDVKVPDITKVYTLFEVNEYTSNGGKSGEIVITDAKLGADYSPYSGQYSEATVTQEIWHRIAYVVDVFYAADETIGSVKIYLDGVNVNEIAYGSVDGSSSPNAGETTAAFKIGGNNEGAGFDNTQDIDNIIIFDRALTDAEMQIFGAADASNDVSSIEAEEELTLYPNPTTYEFIPYTSFDSEADIQIYNSIGQLVMTKTVDTNAKVDVSSLAKGIYIVQAKNKNGKIKSGKLIIK